MSESLQQLCEAVQHCFQLNANVACQHAHNDNANMLMLCRCNVYCPSLFPHTCQDHSPLTVQHLFPLPGAALWTDRSGVMEEAALSCGECPPNAHT